MTYKMTDKAGLLAGVNNYYGLLFTRLLARLGRGFYAPPGAFSRFSHHCPTVGLPDCWPAGWLETLPFVGILTQRCGHHRPLCAALRWPLTACVGRLQTLPSVGMPTQRCGHHRPLCAALRWPLTACVFRLLADYGF